MDTQLLRPETTDLDQLAEQSMIVTAEMEAMGFQGEVTEEHDPFLVHRPLRAPQGVNQSAWDARRRFELALSDRHRAVGKKRFWWLAARKPKTSAPVQKAAKRPGTSARSRAPSRPSAATPAKAPTSGSDPPPSEPPPAQAARSVPRTRGAVSVQPVSQDSKLCRVERHTVLRKDGKKGLKLVNVGARCAASYVAMLTCPNECPRKGMDDCYPVASGPATRNLIKRLNAAAVGHSSAEIIAELVYEIDHAYVRGVPQDGPRGGGLPHRLTVAGDFGTEAEARMAGGALTRWRKRGGGIGWGYTHAWRSIRREAFGADISPLASVDSVEEIEQADEMGYASALVVEEFPESRPYRLPGLPWRFIPCPHEVQKAALDARRVKTGMSDEDYEAARRKVLTCVDCGLCLAADKRFEKHDVIVFEEHGPVQAKERNRQMREAEALLQVGLNGPRPLPTGPTGVGGPVSATGVPFGIDSDAVNDMSAGTAAASGNSIDNQTANAKTRRTQRKDRTP